jgi:hypothetical protein
MNYAAIHTSFYDRLRIHSDGARALFGVFPATFPKAPAYANARAIFPRAWLKAFAGAGVTFPWGVYAPGPVSGESGEMRGVFGSWWLYVAETQAEEALYPLVTAVEALYGYTNRHAIAGGELTVTAGQIFHEPARTAYGVQVSMSYLQRG